MPKNKRNHKNRKQSSKTVLPTIKIHPQVDKATKKFGNQTQLIDDTVRGIIVNVGARAEDLNIGTTFLSDVMKELISGIQMLYSFGNPPADDSDSDDEFGSVLAKRVGKMQTVASEWGDIGFCYACRKYECNCDVHGTTSSIMQSYSNCQSLLDKLAGATTNNKINFFQIIVGSKENAMKLLSKNMKVNSAKKRMRNDRFLVTMFQQVDADFFEKETMLKNEKICGHLAWIKIIDANRRQIGKEASWCLDYPGKINQYAHPWWPELLINVSTDTFLPLTRTMQTMASDVVAIKQACSELVEQEKSEKLATIKECSVMQRRIENQSETIDRLKKEVKTKEKEKKDDGNITYLQDRCEKLEKSQRDRDALFRYNQQRIDEIYELKKELEESTDKIKLLELQLEEVNDQLEKKKSAMNKVIGPFTYGFPRLEIIDG